MKCLINKILLTAVVGLIFASTAQAAPTNVTYQMVFVPTWTMASHPVEYPNTFFKKGHFSGLIGATHKASYNIFAPGKKPTPGLENLSEKGKHMPLDSEIQAAIKAGKAGVMIETTDAIKGPAHQPVVTTFKANQKFPLVTVVAMAAPSPDWFVGVRNVRLYAKGKWVPTVSAIAYAWDSGGDRGKTYLAADQNTNSKDRTKIASTKHFIKNGKRIPVGVFVFVRIPE